jgi:hypothetical protein
VTTGLVLFACALIAFGAYWYPRPAPFLNESPEEYAIPAIVGGIPLLTVGIHALAVALYVWIRAGGAEHLERHTE